MSAGTVYYTEITTKAICKNGSEMHGAKAYSRFRVGDKGRFIQISIHGDTRQAAKERLIKLLSNGGENPIEKVDELPTEKN